MNLACPMALDGLVPTHHATHGTYGRPHAPGASPTSPSTHRFAAMGHPPRSPYVDVYPHRLVAAARGAFGREGVAQASEMFSFLGRRVGGGTVAAVVERRGAATGLAAVLSPALVPGERRGGEGAVGQRGRGKKKKQKDTSALPVPTGFSVLDVGTTYHSRLTDLRQTPLHPLGRAKKLPSRPPSRGVDGSDTGVFPFVVSCRRGAGRGCHGASQGGGGSRRKPLGNLSGAL